MSWLRSRWVGLGLAALAIAIQLPIYDRSVVPMDEGHLAAVANWLLGGEHLYRDLHTGIFPGIYYLATLLFSIFGPDLIVTRIAEVGVVTATTLLLWRISLRVASPYWALLPSLLFLSVVVVSFPVLSMFNYSAVSLAFALGALLALLRYLASGRPADGVLLGAAIACSVLVKQNFGALLVTACAIGLIWGRGAAPPLRDRSLVRVLAPVVATGASMALVALLHFAWIGALGDFLSSTILTIGSSQLESFNNPIPPLLGPHPDEGRFVFLYTPPTMFNALMRGESYLGVSLAPVIRSAAIRLSYGLPILMLAGGALLLFRSGETNEAARARLRAVVVFSLLMSLGIFPSAIWSHLAFVLPAVLLLAAVLGDRAEHASQASDGAGISLRVSAGVAGALSILAAFSLGDRIHAWYPVPLEVERASISVSWEQAEQVRETVAFIEHCAEGRDSIFVVPDMPLFYFLTDRLNPTPYDLTIPGNVDGDLIVRLLDRDRTRCVVFNPRMYPEFPPWDALFPQLLRYFDANYARSALIGREGNRWHGLKRK